MGMSGSGKLSALKAFEDLGYYSVDNLPLDLVPRFAELVATSAEMPTCCSLRPTGPVPRSTVSRHRPSNMHAP